MSLFIYCNSYIDLNLKNSFSNAQETKGSILSGSYRKEQFFLSLSLFSDCARTRFLLERKGKTELPTCCANGNFRRKQCRRGLCYCVDCNGNQEEKEMISAQCDGSCSVCAESKPGSNTEESSAINWETHNEEIFL
jgi:hypothetical protein